ncbi:MAG: LamB/YcsF family protein, partial [Fusobacterium sp.]|nr:LamB/YcsF family protein [Fusobacterium sp.]
MKYYVDLNSDIGEGFGSYKLGLDEEIMKCVTSVNLACGWHAGDPLIMDRTVKFAKTNNV